MRSAPSRQPGLEDVKAQPISAREKEMVAIPRA